MKVMAVNCVDGRACNARPIGNDQAADQYDQPQADVDRQKPTRCRRWRMAALGSQSLRVTAKQWPREQIRLR